MVSGEESRCPHPPFIPTMISALELPTVGLFSRKKYNYSTLEGVLSEKGAPAIGIHTLSVFGMKSRTLTHFDSANTSQTGLFFPLAE